MHKTETSQKKAICIIQLGSIDKKLVMLSRFQLLIKGVVGGGGE